MTEASQLILQEVLKNLFVRGDSTLGKAVFAAKCSLITWYPTDDNYYGPAVLYTLFGDPALRIKHSRLTATGERRPTREAPARTLLRVVPNPAHGFAGIDYELPSPAPVEVRVYTRTGALTKSVAADPEPAGRHRLTLNCHGLPAGIYFAELNVVSPGRPSAPRATAKFVLR